MLPGTSALALVNFALFVDAKQVKPAVVHQLAYEVVARNDVITQQRGALHDCDRVKMKQSLAHLKKLTVCYVRFVENG